MALVQQNRQEGGVAADHREQVDVDDPFPLVDREVFGQATGEDADVVHDDVDASEICERGGLEVLHRVGGADVAAHAGRSTAGVGDLGRDAACALDVDAGDYDRGPASGE